MAGPPSDKLDQRSGHERMGDLGLRVGTHEAATSQNGHFRTYDLRTYHSRTSMTNEKKLQIVLKTSGVHLLIPSSYRLSIEFTGISSRKTAELDARAPRSARARWEARRTGPR